MNWGGAREGDSLCGVICSLNICFACFPSSSHSREDSSKIVLSNLVSSPTESQGQRAHSWPIFVGSIALKVNQAWQACKSLIRCYHKMGPQVCVCRQIGVTSSLSYNGSALSMTFIHPSIRMIYIQPTKLETYGG